MPETSIPTGLRIETATVSGFRCFEKIDWERIDPKFNVLVAMNGGGKTAILDAIAVGLAPFPRTRAQTGGWVLNNWDVRRTLTSDGRVIKHGSDVRIKLSTSVAPEALTRPWVIERGPAEARRTRTSGAREFASYAERSFRLREGGVPLPVMAYYGTSRLWRHQSLTKSRRGRDVENGYRDCLDPRVSYAAFEEWVGAISHDRQLSDDRDARQQWEFLVDTLGEVLAPVGLSRFEYSAQERALLAGTDITPMVPVALLSDGTRTLLGLVGDLVRRICLLNAGIPHFRLADTPGIVLVDEIDLHLHPKWQQSVVASLKKAFPAVQWIVTTHSPQVLSSVPREQVWVFRQADGIRISNPRLQTEGESSDMVLGDAFGVEALPPSVWRDRWNNLAQLVWQPDDSPELVALLNTLTTHFGEDHRNLVAWRATRASHGTDEGPERQL